MGFWQDNDFYKGWKKSQGKSDKPVESIKDEYDFSELELIKLFPESDEDIYDAYNAPENYGHQMDALKHCVDNGIPFLLWNGMLFNWHQEKID